jgi:pseudomonalisin
MFSSSWSRAPKKASHLRNLLPAVVAASVLLIPLAVKAAPAVVTGGVSLGAVQTTVFETDVLPALDSAKALGATASGTPVEIGVTLSNPNAAAQNAAYNAIYTTGSPDYHHFLTAAQVAAEFGVPRSTFDRLKSWATRDGLKVAFSPNTNEYMLLEGTAASAEKTFSVHLEDYKQGSKAFYANTAGPTVPAGLGVSGIIGLNNLLAAKTDQTTCAGSDCVGLTTPQDLWSIYDQPTNIKNKNQDFGQGQSMAVLGEGAVSGVISDLRAFETEHDLPKIRINVDSVGDDFQDTSGSGEWDIDTQASTGMSPEARSETLFFAKDLTDSSVLADISAWGSDPNGPYQANASFGECEEDPTSAITGDGGGVSTPLGGPAGTAGVEFTTESENALEQATLQGKTLFSSTGDTGSSCPVVEAAVIGAGNGVANQGYPETNYPASSPYVVAVGGTVLYGTESTAKAPASNAKRFIEYAWDFTGGGNTFYIPEPKFQDGVPILDEQDCLTQPDGTPYTSPTPCRGIPDVSAQSGDIATNGYGVTMGGVNDEQGAGTSLASPLWMGMWTRVQAAAKRSKGKYTLGFADPVLYKIGLNTTEDPKAFFNIGGGAPSSPVTSNGYYTSLPRTPTIDPSGWSYTSGLGSPNLIPLAQYATGNKTLKPTDDLSPLPAKDCGQPGLAKCSGGGGACNVNSGLWTNPAHTATDPLGNSDPQLSLLRGAMSVSGDGDNLRVLLTVSDLTNTVPTGAEGDEWYGLWSYDGTEYFANAELTAVPDATPTFSDGTVTKTGNTTTYNPVNTDDTGLLTVGNDGTVEIDVPFSHIGSPPAATILTGPAGSTFIAIGVPGEESALEAVDSGGPACNYSVGGGPTSQS